MGAARQPRTELVVQWRGAALRGSTRAEQRADLVTRLAGRLQDIPGVTIEWGSLSVAAQTVVVIVDTPLVAGFIRSAKSEGLRVDEAVERKIVDEQPDGGDW